ncbi:hypothetical protein FACS1894184_15050 [Clostridia bacterium]|nr:hypothetical protein FACS1894184_15050 [Clostridia bacterium]
MSSRNLTGPLAQHGGTAAQMAANNPILKNRELGLETDTRRVKIGDGATTWNSLPYISTGTQAVSVTLAASGWSNKAQTRAISGVSANTHGIMMLGQNVTAAQYEALAKAQIAVTGQGSGTVTLTAFGDVPAIDIPLTLMIVG